MAKLKKAKAAIVESDVSKLIFSNQFTWELASNNPEVNDGLLVNMEDGAREKFLKQVNPTKFDLKKEYVELLQKEKERCFEIIELQERLERDANIWSEAAQFDKALIGQLKQQLKQQAYDNYMLDKRLNWYMENNVIRFLIKVFFRHTKSYKESVITKEYVIDDE